MTKETADTRQAPAISDDIIWGTAAIAHEIHRSLSETQYLIRNKAIPVGRLGPKTIFASRSQLRRHLTPKGA
jgi:hypothetical protein